MMPIPRCHKTRTAGKSLSPNVFASIIEKTMVSRLGLCDFIIFSARKELGTVGAKKLRQLCAEKSRLPRRPEITRSRFGVMGGKLDRFAISLIVSKVSIA